MDLKRNEIIKQKLRSTWYNGKLHGSVTLGIHMLEIVSWRIKNKKTEDYIDKCNGRPFREEKEWYKVISITISESTENVCHVTRKNLHSVHAPYNTKMPAMESTDDKTFWFRNDLLCTGLGEKYLIWAKAF